MIDTIPLAEVEVVKDMSSLDEEVDRTKFANALMIATSPEGHNSGRTYYLQASSEEHCKRLVRDFASLASDAVRRAEANTRFAESQYFVRNVFQSNPFQLVSACLILGVRVRPACRHGHAATTRVQKSHTFHLHLNPPPPQTTQLHHMPESSKPIANREGVGCVRCT